MSKHTCMFQPDWCEKWTKEEAEKELFNFVFKGEGWYHWDQGNNGFDVCLVIALKGTDKFEFNVYNGRDPRNMLEMISKLPQHERSCTY